MGFATDLVQDEREIQIPTHKDSVPVRATDTEDRFPPTTMSKNEAKKAIEKAKKIYKRIVHTDKNKMGSTAEKLADLRDSGAAAALGMGTLGAVPSPASVFLEGAAAAATAGTGVVTILERFANKKEKDIDKNQRVLKARDCCEVKCEIDPHGQVLNLRGDKDNHGLKNFGCAESEGMFLYVNEETDGDPLKTCKKLCKADAALTDTGIPHKNTPECAPNPRLTVYKHCGTWSEDAAPDGSREDTDTEVDTPVEEAPAEETPVKEDAGTDLYAKVQEPWKMHALTKFNGMSTGDKYNVFMLSEDLKSDDVFKVEVLEDPYMMEDVFLEFIVSDNHSVLTEENYEVEMKRVLEWKQKAIKSFENMSEEIRLNILSLSEFVDPDLKDELRGKKDDQIMLFEEVILDPDLNNNPPIPPILTINNYKDYLGDPDTHGGSKIYKKRKPKTRRKRKSTKKSKTNRKQKSRRKQKTNRKQKSKRKSKIKKTKRR
jgi:hypothetical protein